MMVKITYDLSLKKGEGHDNLLFKTTTFFGTIKAFNYDLKANL